MIETRGLADPGPILQTFATDRALDGEFFVEVVVAVIDASCGLATLDWSAEARKQVILADRLVISKTDLCPLPIPPPHSAAKTRVDALVLGEGTGGGAQLISRLRGLKGHAPTDTAIGGPLDPRRLTDAEPSRPGPPSGFIGATRPS